MKKKDKVSRLLIALIILLAIAIIVVAVILIRYGLGYKADRDAYKAYESLAFNSSSEASPEGSGMDMDVLRSINGDAAGWIKACGGKISGPVVSASDDEYYLTHRFDKTESSCGTFFADRFTSPAFKGPITVIFGHNMNDGSMFHELMNYEKEDFFKANDTFTVYTDAGAEEYQVFSAFISDYNDIPWIADRCAGDSGNKEHCLNYNGRGGLDMADFIEYVSGRSLFKTNTAAYRKKANEAKVVALCTCETTNTNTSKRMVVYGVHFS